jgi:hypothetical protein
MALLEDLERIAPLAFAYADPGEELAGIVAAEPATGERVYVCAFTSGGERRTWLALDSEGEPVQDRARVRDAVSISALCEVAVESAAGGDLDELRSQLLALRLRENPPGIEEAEEAALALERTVGAPPRLASPHYLDEVGAATRRLELALGPNGGSPFAQAMKQATAAVEALKTEVEASYKRALGVS